MNKLAINPTGDNVWPYLVRCPVCEFESTHHKSVAHYRRAEDERTQVVWIGPEGPQQENPSPRRSAVGIRFEGECGHSWWMNIIQHKGQTFIDFSSSDTE